MLACARLGITHSVVFGGFSAEALKARIQDLGATLVITADGGFRRGKEVKLKPAVDEALAECPGRARRDRLPAHGFGTAMQAGRDYWWHDLDAALTGPKRALSRRAAGQRASSVRALHVGHHRQAEGHSAHHRRLSDAGDRHHEVGVRSAGRGHLLVLGRYRLGDGAQLHRLRAALGGRDDGDVRRRARLSAVRPLVAHRRKISRQYFLHVAHGDSRADPAGRSVAGRARSFEPAAAGVGGRADQSGGLGMVSPRDRQRALPDCGYVVADGNRRDHDRADAGRGAGEARLGDAADAGRHSGHRGFARQSGGARITKDF